MNIENARFDNNYMTGVRLYKSVGSTFSDVEFINHNEPKKRKTGIAGSEKIYAGANVGRRTEKNR